MLNARLVSHGPDVPHVILLAIEDVTERRLTERRLATQRRELERSNAALNEFAFVASHDLQEPLRKILSFGERLEHVGGTAARGRRAPLPGAHARCGDAHAHAHHRPARVLTDRDERGTVRADRPGVRSRARSLPTSRRRSPTRAAESTSDRCR